MYDELTLTLAQKLKKNNAINKKFQKNVGFIF